jgi:hypothetical protein
MFSAFAEVLAKEGKQYAECVSRVGQEEEGSKEDEAKAER